MFRIAAREMDKFKWVRVKTLVLLGVASVISRGGAQGCKQQMEKQPRCLKVVSDIRDNT